MTTTFAVRTTTDDPRAWTPTAPSVRPRRVGQGSGRTQRPQARPARPVAAPGLAVPGGAVRSCVGEAATPVVRPAARAWRLTDRGIAVLLVAATLIVTAAVAVVALTAVRVTGESFQPYGQSHLARH